MGIKQRKLVLAGGYVLLGVAAAAILGFSRYVYPLYAQVRERVRSQEEALWKIQTIWAERTVKGIFAAAEKFLADAQNVSEISTNILQEIKSKAGTAGLNVINIKPLSGPDESDTGAFDVKLETEGDLRGFGRFLYDLDNSPYLFSLKYTQINAQAQNEPLKVQMLLSVALAKG
jgi:General secretion pathway protein M.